MKLSIIVPVFNEGSALLKNLDLLVSEVTPHFQGKAGTDYEILVISDGSTDNTNSVLRDCAQRPGIQAVVLDRNQGKGAAVRAGFGRARGEWILFIDGGMELHPKEIPIFLGLAKLYDADIVIGSKRHPQSQVDYPMTRRFLSSIYQQVVRHWFDLDVTDTQVGIKLFRSEVIRAVLPDLTVNRYGFDLEILALARAKGFRKVLEAPIRLDYFGTTQRRGLREVWHLLSMSWLVWKDTLAVRRKVRELHQRRSL